MSLYSIFSSSNQYISYKYTSTVDRHMYFAVDMLGLTKSLTALVKFRIRFASCTCKSEYLVGLSP